MLDAYGRGIDYLRVAVTDRCNLRCRYCVPEGGPEAREEPLTLEQFARLIGIAANAGIRRVRLTGGEVLVRKNIVRFIERIAAIPQIEEVTMTTNGTRFAAMASELQAAGLSRVNFSLDTLDARRFYYITKSHEWQEVLHGIHKALELTMAPVKINMVVIKGVNDQEILDFARLAYTLPLHVRFIEYMPVGNLPFWHKDRLVSVETVRAEIEKSYELFKIPVMVGGGPASYYKISGGQGTVGFISPMTSHFCFHCNRIRLTADGRLRSCLFANQEVNLRLGLENGATDEWLAAQFSKAIKEKPLRHVMEAGWGVDNPRKMYQIGG